MKDVGGGFGFRASDFVLSTQGVQEAQGAPFFRDAALSALNVFTVGWPRRFKEPAGLREQQDASPSTSLLSSSRSILGLQSRRPTDRQTDRLPD